MLTAPAKPAIDRLDRTISANDGMLAGNEPHYFAVGRSAIQNIKQALACGLEDDAQPAHILDFPCGHGRVLRHLRAEFPRSQITACDLLQDGVDFCASRFDAIPVYSDLNPARIALPRNAFDLIWVGSLFTHFDAKRWSTFLSLLRDLLQPGGVLVFSTHGRYSRELAIEQPSVYGLDAYRRNQLLKQCDNAGFGYVDYPSQRDYGISLSMPAWVCRLVTGIPELRMTGFSERSWDQHHDVYSCVRDERPRGLLSSW